MAHFTYHLQKLLATVGKECIYKDSGLIVLAKMSCLTLREDEIEFNLKPIHTAGFSPKVPRPFKVSGKVEFMSFRKNYISHPYVNFLLFSEPGHVKHLVKFAAALPDIDILLKEFRAVMRSDFKVKAKRPATKAQGV
jgi:hypothetical protein